MARLLGLILLFWVPHVFAVPAYSSCPAGKFCSAPKWHAGNPADYRSSVDATLSAWLAWANATKYGGAEQWQSTGPCSLSSVIEYRCPLKSTKNGSVDNSFGFVTATCPTGSLISVAGAARCLTTEDKQCVAGIAGASTDLVNGSYCDPTGCVTEATTIVTPKGSRTAWVSTNRKCTTEAPAPSSAPQPPDEGSSAPTGSGPCPGGADVCPPSKGSCPKGTFATEVGGEALCVSTQPLKDEPAKTGQNNGPAASTGTSTKTTNTKTTTNPDGSTTTTETSSESKSGTEEKPNDMAGFCKENPEAAVCGDGGSWAGGCGSFTCGGDPVQCAQARAAAEIQCKLEIGGDDPNVSAGQSAVNGGATPNGHPRNDGETVNFSLGTMIDATPLFGSSGECIADKTVPMLGKTLTIPFSRMCTALELLGYAFLACCYLSAAYIVFRKA